MPINVEPQIFHNLRFFCGKQVLKWNPAVAQADNGLSGGSFGLVD